MFFYFITQGKCLVCSKMNSFKFCISATWIRSQMNLNWLLLFFVVGITTWKTVSKFQSRLKKNLCSNFFFDLWGVQSLSRCSNVADQSGACSRGRNKGKRISLSGIVMYVLNDVWLCEIKYNSSHCIVVTLRWNWIQTFE